MYLAIPGVIDRLKLLEMLEGLELDELKFQKCGGRRDDVRAIRCFVG